MAKFFLTLSVLFSIALVYATSGSSVPSESKIDFKFTSKLNWREELSDFSSKNSLHYILVDDESIAVDVEFIENNVLFDAILEKENSQIIQDLIEGKNSVNTFVGFKKISLTTSRINKTEDRIEVELEGNYSNNKTTKFFAEKYVILPSGVLMNSFDWTLNSKKNLLEIAKKDFSQIGVVIE